MSKESVRNQKKKASPQPNDARNESRAVEEHVALAQWVLNTMNLKPTPQFGYDDAFNAALFGLVRAVRKFDSANGSRRFSTFAVTCIRREVMRERKRAVGILAPPHSIEAAAGVPAKTTSTHAADHAHKEAEEYLATLPACHAVFLRKVYYEGLAPHDALPRRTKDQATRLLRQLTGRA